MEMGFLSIIMFGVGALMVYGIICVAFRSFNIMSLPELHSKPEDRDFLLPSEERQQRERGEN